MSAPMNREPDPVAEKKLPSYAVVIPTIGRGQLTQLLQTLRQAAGPLPEEIIVVDDRPDPDADPMAIPTEPLAGAAGIPVRVLQSGGRGPATARNTGWTAARSEWIAFLDDDVRVPSDWPSRLIEDLNQCGPDVAGSTADIVVPPPVDRRPTDDERNTMGLAGARWITADIAYRRSVLAAVGGFDQTFPRAYREDSDLALRVIAAGYRIASGGRVTEHPLRSPDLDHWTASVRRQRGNADDALMLARHGPDWRRDSGAGRGRLAIHLATTGTAAAAAGLVISGRPRAALVPASVWLLVTGRFALTRILPGPRSTTEIIRMLLSSTAIPPVAVYHRLRGEYAARYGAAAHPEHVRSADSGLVTTSSAIGTPR